MINFTIIIPHKNAPNLLQHCLSTIPERDDIQVIVVDDNSDDKIVNFEHFPKWMGEHYEYYLTKEGKGAGFARNVGLEHAKGKYILFADADDWFLPNLYEELSKVKESDADVHFYKVDSVNIKTGESGNRHQGRNASIDAYLNHEVSAKDAATWYTSVVGQLYSRDLIERHIIRCEEYMVSNDALFAAKAGCLAGRVEFHDVAFYMISENETGLTPSKYIILERYLQWRRSDLHVHRFLKKHHIRKPSMCMLQVTMDCRRRFGNQGFIRALNMIASERAIFYGFGDYIERKINKFIKKRC